MQNLNLDFSQSLAIDTEKMTWTGSPAQGVVRKPLARAEQERGHATSIVRYEAEARFKRHRHPLGEEILVLEGLFSDEQGDYGPGSYMRNPPGTGHAPFSQQGCTLFVKLHQFAAQDNKQFVLNTHGGKWQYKREGQQVMSLHHYGEEQVMLIKIMAGGIIEVPEHVGGEEILILSGELCDKDALYSAGTWLRRPNHEVLSAREDSLIWLKTGHFTG